MPIIESLIENKQARDTHLELFGNSFSEEMSFEGKNLALSKTSNR
jgi:hypothetical protein